MPAPLSYRAGVEIDLLYRHGAEKGFYAFKPLR